MLLMYVCYLIDNVTCTVPVSGLATQYRVASIQGEIWSIDVIVSVSSRTSECQQFLHYWLALVFKQYFVDNTKFNFSSKCVTVSRVCMLSQWGVNIIVCGWRKGANWHAIIYHCQSLIVMTISVTGSALHRVTLLPPAHTGAVELLYC